MKVEVGERVGFGCTGPSFRREAAKSGSLASRLIAVLLVSLVHYLCLSFGGMEAYLQIVNRLLVLVVALWALRDDSVLVVDVQKARSLLVRRRFERTVRGGRGIVLLLLMLRLRRGRRVLRMRRPLLFAGGESCIDRRICGVLVGLRVYEACDMVDCTNCRELVA